MDPTLEAFVRTWPLDPWVVGSLVVTSLVYLRGWNDLRRRSRRFGPAQAGCFLGGLFAVFLALASPIEAFAGLLLQVHMVQHLLLMIVAPPLLWNGAPLLPLLRGLPGPVREYWAAPLFRASPVRTLFRTLTQPKVAWIAFVAATWVWHAPGLYELALRSDAWHTVEHACFLGSGLLFWYVVVQPYPARPRFSRWLLVPYLLVADVQNTALSALFTFSGRVLYPHYDSVPRLLGVSALDDQAAAGLIMWVPGSIVFLVPLVRIAHGLLRGDRKANVWVRPVDSAMAPAPRPRIPLIVVAPPRTRTGPDVLRWPLLGPFLRWRHARLALQVPLLVLAVLVVVDGLVGPQASPMNLAGVLPWIHWRGLVVLGLLVAGNVFCMACPFMVPRRLARRWLPGQRAWPRWLRSKWLALALLVLFFGAYEVASLWASPWWTAWIIVGYFVAAVAVDGFFRGAAFCKYVCPIGQFQLTHALLAPLEVRVRDVGRCLTCTTKECIRGGAGVSGCELGLYVPRKSGNMDCTFCLDCIHACPHDNVGLVPVVPGSDLATDPHRSGVGRFRRRPDLAALVVVLVFAAFASAAAMIVPVVDRANALAAALGLRDAAMVRGAFLIAALTAVPAGVVVAVTTLSRWWSGDAGPWLESAMRFTYALLPLGFGVWLAHYSFHFFSGLDTAVPVFQRFATDWGISALGEPAWRCACCGSAGAGLLRLEILFLDVGLVASLYLGYRAARDRFGKLAPRLAAFAPWAALMVFLFVFGIWILFQPMEMRGMAQ